MCKEIHPDAGDGGPAGSWRWVWLPFARMSPVQDGRRVGLLGGTFDPPHLGHLIVAECVRVELDLAEVQFVVAGQPWMKDECSPADDRLRMAELAVAGLDRFTVNRTEIDRQGPTYTSETLQELSQVDPDCELYFLLGADAAQRLGEWREIERALALATFVVVTRPGYSLAPDTPMIDRVRTAEVPDIGISSTDLRRRFRDGAAVRFQVPEAVERYVYDRDLYREGG